MDLSSIDPKGRLYLRPISFIESPQQHDGETARLAGTMLWFSAVELIAKSGENAQRNIIPVSGFVDHIASLPNAFRDHATTVFARLIAPRPGLQMGARIIRLDQPQVMGILNVTPDSFSDGGKHIDPVLAISSGVAMAASGAAMVDVGGESTRPGATLVWEGDEIARTEPVIKGLATAGTAVSVDTRKAGVMQAALNAGAAMINDISALLYDDQAIEVARSCQCPIVLMHAPSQSSDPHKDAHYEDVVFDVYDWLEARVEALVVAGIGRDRLLIDPGIGFGKSMADNLALINNLALFHGIGCPILFGASRKRMIGALSNEAPSDMRLAGSLFLAMKAIEQGVQIVRVHDVSETVQAIHVWRGLRDAALTART
jgi:dihydropteroate synthase